MQYAICADYCGATVLLDVCDTPEEAEHNMKFPYYMNDEQDRIYPSEMWIEPYEQIPFADPLSPEEVTLADFGEEDLPF